MAKWNSIYLFVFYMIFVSVYTEARKHSPLLEDMNSHGRNRATGKNFTLKFCFNIISIDFI